MKDSNNNNQANNEARVSDATYTQQNKAKSSSTSRTSDIYERFLNRVESIDGDSDRKVAHSNIESSNANLENLVKIKKSSTYEPLNEDELRSFTSQEEAIDSYDSEEPKTTSTDINFNDNFDGKKVKVAAVAIPVLNEKNEDAVPSAHEGYEDNHTNYANYANYTSQADLTNELPTGAEIKDASTQQSKSTSSSKLLIIGIVSGLLLSAAIILLLSKTGFLSTSADSSKTTSSTSSNTPTAEAEQPAVIDTDTAPSLNTDTQADQNPSANEGNTAANVQEAPVAQQSTKDSNSNAAAEPAITVEDFKEEAQNTLYRETND